MNAVVAEIAAEEGIGRRTWMRAEGRLQARYTASVELERTWPVVGS